MESFIAKFTDKKIDYIKKSKNYFSSDKTLIELEKKIPETTFSSGVYLGEEIKKEFSPSIALLDCIAPLTDKKVVIDEKSAWLFLCGRDVFGKSIKEVLSDERLDYVIVLNERHEVLGYGKVQSALTNIKNPEKVVIKNILDRGSFLRRER